LEFLRTTRGRVGAALLTSLVVVALVVIFREALPLLPAMLAAVWVSIFASQERVEPPARRLTLVLTGGLVALAGAGVLVLFLIGI
jgi:hypothetical protein